MPYPAQDYPEEREYVCDGSHVSRSMIPMEKVRDGREDPDQVLLEICADPACARIVVAECQCVNNFWNDTGTVLRCGLCGRDGT